MGLTMVETDPDARLAVMKAKNERQLLSNKEMASKKPNGILITGFFPCCFAQK